MATYIYTRGDYTVLPSDDTDLENAFGGTDYADVATNNEVYVTQTAQGQFPIFLFKIKNDSAQSIKVAWNGNSDMAPSDATVYLQIYDRVTAGGTWVTLDSNNSAAADEDFNLSGEIFSDYNKYYDSDFYISIRAYQALI